MATSERPFTDRFIAGLCTNAEQLDVMEVGGTGFGVRVTNMNLKKFFYRYNIDGKRRFLALGTYKATETTAGITLAMARKLYIDARNMVKAGIDPLIEKQEVKEARKVAPFVADFVADYIHGHCKENLRGWRNIERALQFDFVPRFGKRKLNEVKALGIDRMLEEVAKRAPVGANRLRAYLSAMFAYAKKKRLAIENPLADIDKPYGNERAKSRYLNENEITTLHKALNVAQMGDVYRDALLMVLITGQRPGEVCSMAYSHVDGDWWEIPASIAKNKQAHRVYLSSLAQQILAKRRQYSESYPFCQAGNPDKPTTKDVLANRLGDVMESLGVDKFTPHDLRRTMATGLAELEVDPYIIELILNHKSTVKRGVAGIYNQYDYAKQKKAAMLLWDSKLQRLFGLIQPDYPEWIDPNNPEDTGLV